jgi:DNA-binding transcriptional ArsR family regulator
MLCHMDTVFKALADESRRDLLDHLYAKGGQTLGELYEPFAKNMSRQAVMKHLNVLESANLVAIVWKGREKLHYLNPVPIHAIQDRWIRKFERQRMDALSALKSALEDKPKKGKKNG